MNEVRKRALRATILALLFMAPGCTYLWMVDYRGVPLTLGSGAMVALMFPAFRVLMKSVPQLIAGRYLVGYAPWQVREVPGDERR